MQTIQMVYWVWGRSHLKVKKMPTSSMPETNHHNTPEQVFDSAMSFSMIVANTSISQSRPMEVPNQEISPIGKYPGKKMVKVWGAMDLVASAENIIAAKYAMSISRWIKTIEKCTLPLTGVSAWKNRHWIWQFWMTDRGFKLLGTSSWVSVRKLMQQKVHWLWRKPWDGDKLIGNWFLNYIFLHFFLNRVLIPLSDRRNPLKTLVVDRHWSTVFHHNQQLFYLSISSQKDI